MGETGGFKVRISGSNLRQNASQLVADITKLANEFDGVVVQHSIHPRYKQDQYGTKGLGLITGDPIVDAIIYITFFATTVTHHNTAIADSNIFHCRSAILRPQTRITSHCTQTTRKMPNTIAI